MRRELLIGCGVDRNKRLWSQGYEKWTNLVTLDINPEVKPDMVWDLEKLPYTWADGNTFDEIHAYHVLEHLGTQGDYRFFFAQFEELWRILKPDGCLAAMVPAWNDGWAWGDPGHRRIISDESLTFLSQAEYCKQLDNPDKTQRTPMTDYRWCYKADFVRIAQGAMDDDDETYFFVLKAIK